MELAVSEVADLAVDGQWVLIRVQRVAGSTPRDGDAMMLVSRDALLGTIGGGQLEFLAMDRARRMLERGEKEGRMDVPLGPDIGQCCGGRVQLGLQQVDANIRAWLLARLEAVRRQWPDVLIFGAGHVGCALARALAPLPLSPVVIDGRAEALSGLPAGVEVRLSALPEAEVRGAATGSLFVIATHDHALDFLIAREALARGNGEYVGMIGSATKRASFLNWLRREEGLTGKLKNFFCPIGGGDVPDKRPAVIAALVAAELIGFSLGGRESGNKGAAGSRIQLEEAR